MKRPTRTTVAGLLTLVAVAVPSSAWYIAGGDAARREAERVRDESVGRAQRVADGLARRVTLRLEVLLQQESERPVTHYVAHFSDPNSDCGCAVVSSSPLASGTIDPLVWSYFQIAPDRAITVPELAAADHLDVCEAGTGQGSPFDPVDVVRQTERRDLLQRDVASLTENIPLRARTYGGWTDADAVSVFAPPIVIGPDAVLAVGSYQWRTLRLAGTTAPAAVRRVSTTVGDLVQGFVISNEALEQDVAGALFPATIVSEPDTSRSRIAEASLIYAPIHLTGIRRWVEVNATGALREARIEGERIIAGFRRGFVGVTLAALLAGVSVIGLIAQTERLARQRAQFAAAAAHELRTPLAGLRVYADMVGENLGNPSQTASYAKQLANEVERLGRVVSNMLGYARLERGVVTVDRREGDIRTLLTDVVERLRPAIEKSGARLHCVVADDLPPLSFDADALYRVVQNLIDNAEKHTRDAADRRIEVRAEETAEGVVISVRDHGPGIPPSLRSRLFRPFERGEEGFPAPGLGLGLPLAKSLVEAHRGHLVYRDAEGGGAMFEAHFPRS